MNETLARPETIQNDAEIRATVRLAANLIWGLAAAVGIPGNLFVLLAIVYFRDMHTISNMYIFNLAVADMLFLAGTPILILQSIQEQWNFGAAMCRMYLIGNGISQFSSPAFIAVLSLDRYLAVCRPIDSEWRTKGKALVASALAWVMVILEMTPLWLFAKLIKGPDPDAPSTCMLFWGNENTFTNLTPPETWNDTQFEKYIVDQIEEMSRQTLFSRRFFTTYAFTLSYLLPLLAVWFFYANIIGKLWKRRRHLWNRKENVKRKTTKVSIMGLAIVVSYTLCFLPYWTLNWSIEMDLSWTRDLNVRLAVSYAAHALQYINSALNPFLYVFLSDAFRKNMLSMVRTGSPAVDFKKSSNSTGGQTTAEQMRMLSSVRDKRGRTTSQLENHFSK